MQVYLTMLITLLTAIWVYIDAKNRGRSDIKAFLWAFGTFMALIIFLPLWLIIRWLEDKERMVLYCSFCNQTFKKIPNACYCPFCGQRLENQEKTNPVDAKSK